MLSSNETDHKDSKLNNKAYWNKWYIAVVAFLIIQVVLFYWITKSFS